jgi:hypothetical protein
MSVADHACVSLTENDSGFSNLFHDFKFMKFFFEPEFSRCLLFKLSSLHKSPHHSSGSVPDFNLMDQVMPATQDCVLPIPAAQPVDFPRDPDARCLSQMIDWVRHCRTVWHIANWFGPSFSLLRFVLMVMLHMVMLFSALDCLSFQTYFFSSYNPYISLYVFVFLGNVHAISSSLFARLALLSFDIWKMLGFVFAVYSNWAEWNQIKLLVMLFGAVVFYTPIIRLLAFVFRVPDPSYVVKS